MVVIFLFVTLCLCICGYLERVNWMTKLTTGKILWILKINDALLVSHKSFDCHVKPFHKKWTWINQIGEKQFFSFFHKDHFHRMLQNEVKRGFTFNLFLFYSFIVDIRRLQTINWKRKRKRKIKKSIRTQLMPSENKKNFPRKEKCLLIFLFILKREGSEANVGRIKTENKSQNVRISYMFIHSEDFCLFCCRYNQLV